jgi:predicted amidohydrolase YtcJ
LTPPAELVFRRGRVLTVDRSFSIASAVAVRDGVIVRVGDDTEVSDLIGSATTVVDLNGATLLPGINDAHLHGCRFGMTRPPLAVDVSYPSVSSIADIVAAVEDIAGTVPAGTWIRGRGWDPAYLTECTGSPGLLPHRRDLDAVTPNHPVCLTDFSGHAAWLNSAALAATWLDRDVQPPEGGIVETDEGGPTGLLREAAVAVVNAAMPARAAHELRAAIRAAVADCNRRGITSFTDPGLTVEEVEAYDDLAKEGQLSARVTGLLLPQWPAGSAAEFASSLDGWPNAAPTVPRHFNVTGVKIFADGIPPNRTSWMAEPYVGGGHGCLATHGPTDDDKVDELRRMIAHAHRTGYQIGVHVTGDRAIDAVVDAFAAAQDARPRQDPRHYVIHADFLSAESMKTLSERGFGANMNPTIKWVIADAEEAVVGSQRAGYEMPYRDAIDAGVRVTSGSDAPVTQPDWLQGLSTMMVREGRATGAVSGPDQRIELAAALRTYTIDAAWQDFADHWKGSIEVGKVADLCVVEGDLLTIDPRDLPNLDVLYTVVAGQVVHARD